MGDILSSAISAVGSFFGTKETNAAAAQRQNEANAFSAEQYASRYQTTVKDLQAAGLNPMLAYSQGAGTAPTSATPAPVQNAIGNAIDSYNRTKATSSQSALQQQQEEVAKSQVTVNSASAAKLIADAKVSDEQAKLIETDRKKREIEIPQVQASTKAYEASATASAASAAQSYKLVEQISQNMENLKAELKRIQQQNDQNAPEAEIAKKYPTTYYIFHKLLPNVSGSLGNISRVIPK